MAEQRELESGLVRPTPPYDSASDLVMAWP